VGYLYGMIYDGRIDLGGASGSEPSRTADLSSSDPTEPPEPQPTEPPAPEPADTFADIKGIFLPGEALADLDGQMLDRAAAAGYNAVIFDAKDAGGQMHYISATELGIQAKSAAPGALTPEQLKAAAEQLAQKGLKLIPRLFAFRDHIGAGELVDARIKIDGVTWFDKAPDNGGRRWLNPYEPDAHRFIIGLAKELQDMGFSLIMVDGVQFPDNDYRAEYGQSELTSLSRSGVLSKFIKDLTAATDRDAISLVMPAPAAIGDGTNPFGGNPVTFGAGSVSPLLLPGTLGGTLTVGSEKLESPAAEPYQAVRMLYAQIRDRVELIDAAARPRLTPFIQADGYSAAQIAEELRGLKDAGGGESYVLYSAEGKYVFN
ncbi:MAG: putative glycoside hydrolase, partial [Oscillospiraceae bacterium]|nr:putative glycoside hydrolase [Oscillospiraceae bacterium]